MKFSVILTFLCLCTYSEQRSTPADDSYIAAVVEYEVRRDVDVNVMNYVELIASAATQSADIVVFPEMTLTSGTRAITIPINSLLNEQPIPALEPSLYDEILVTLSSAARQYKIYVVVNVQEEVNCTDAPGEYCPEKKYYLFNTNVVFDRDGAVIDRYRKINLFGEFTRTPAFQPDLGIFDTDFGVTFGHFICFDLMFQVPAIQVAEKYNLTDIIFTTMWFSEMPYLTAVQIQESYAYTMNVNFIASGANNVRVGSAGSGIYSGKAGALVSIMPGIPTTRLLVAKVPKTPGQLTETYPGPIYDDPVDQDQLVLIRDPSLPSHVSKLLVPGFQEFTLVDKEVSCKFTVRLTQSDGATSYQYRAGAFSGVRTFSGLGSGGNRICAVFSCMEDTIESCGSRFSNYISNTTSKFEELSIIATVPTPVVNATLEAHSSTYFPLSLDVSIMPLKPEHYTYQEAVSGGVTTYTLNLLDGKDDLYSFAIWGRFYETDGEEATPPLEVATEETQTEQPSTTEPEESGEPDSANVHLLNTVLLIPLLALIYDIYFK